MHLLPDTIVSLRRCRWRIVAVRSFDDCALVTLRGVSAPWFGVERRVLSPFERFEPIARAARPRWTTRARWRHACRAALASDTRPGGIRGALAAHIDVLPFQLEPALAVAGGHGCRALLADEVGLGKTIQAALIVTDLRARGAARRVLVLTPAGLRDQWRIELRDRFALDAQILDAAAVRAAAAALPADVNPWTTVEVAIASIDFVKRPDVLAAAAARPWDVLIVDEAHGAASDSDRRAAVETLGSRAAYLVLATATPHSGDAEAFAALCRIGRAHADEALVVFRRTRADAGLAVRRRIRPLRVRASAHERRLHARLRQYGDAVLAERPHAWLALSVLHKRALSSAAALAASVDHRLAALADCPASPETQLHLPLDPSGETSADDQPPPWAPELALSSIERERQLLSALAHSARRAAARESKVSALARLLRRTRESVLVFTEYRDTLSHVARAIRRPAIVLHGGLTREDRRAAVDAFTRAPGQVLLATDAAGEGLNLHATCRLVVNMELPWNPMRLEQRIGRVDRLGQRRRVHAVHLIARGTREMALLSRLRDRVSRARAAIGAPDPIGADEERAAAETVVLRRTPSTPPPAAAPIPHTVVVDVRTAARADAIHLAALRRCLATRSGIPSHEPPTPVAIEARGALRRVLAGRRLEIWRFVADDERGCRAASRVVGILVGDDGDEQAETVLAESERSWLAEAAAEAQAFWAARLQRDVAILAEERSTVGSPEQPMLFADRRLARNHRLVMADRAERANAIEQRIADARAASALVLRPRELLAVVHP